MNDKKSIVVPLEAHEWLAEQARTLRTSIGEVVVDVIRAVEDYEGEKNVKSEI
jgi:hypothetical protein